ncbi:hypothetical protein Y032_0405g877 [Ancylostoma ceylanicum]|uniref:Uncharacterized protein n=1 Tax=Ancylostoma ceylanicum TaxID=53326 RepID=A0A016X291_9BILA|nr:hypothetical protein Y032_0405g877 [Ancylostoma ceylanicum]
MESMKGFGRLSEVQFCIWRAISATSLDDGREQGSPTSDVRYAGSTEIGTVHGTAAMDECDAAVAIHHAEQNLGGVDPPTVDRKKTRKKGDLLCSSSKLRSQPSPDVCERNKNGNVL